MYLKRLEIQGFKSFADKVKLEFNKGITSVVGPNGSGKSNIGEAIRWVLGEQSAKVLRGIKMEDIIFVGTEFRKPIGFAEVSITIDNSNGMLPFEYTEVTVTRRVYRSGESEYIINKIKCRLKDVHSLFFDTGIGRDGYSIIGQGRIDEILSTKSEDRRHIFEEASGIVKYKMRKIESERKLEKTEENLTRINDILSELEYQMNPLKEQSEKAKSFLDLRKSLNELEISMYVEQIIKIKKSLQEVEDKYNIIKDDIELNNIKIEKIQLKITILGEHIKSEEQKYEISIKDFYELESKIEKYYSNLQLNSEKLRNTDSDNLKLESEKINLENKMKELKEDKYKTQSKLEYFNKTLESYEKKLEEHNKKLDSLIGNLDDNEKYIEDTKQNLMDTIDSQSEKKIQINNADNSINALNTRYDNLNNEIEENEFELEDSLNREFETREIIKNTGKDSNKSNEQVKSIKDKQILISNELSWERKIYDKNKSELDYKMSRKRIIKEMEENYDGYNKSVKMLLREVKENNSFGKGILGALAQLISVDKKFESAIEMSLGGALQNIVTETEEEAKRSINYLKMNKLGRATFLPINAIKERFLDRYTIDSLNNQKGFCGIASDLVHYDKNIEKVLNNLLGRVVIVDNLDNGINISRIYKNNFRIVTLDGDILNAGGSMSGGSKNEKVGGILNRSRELGELEIEINKLNNLILNGEKKINDLTNKSNEFDVKLENENILIRNYELILIREESYLAQLLENIEKIESKNKILKSDLESTEYNIKEEKLKINLLKKELEDIENNILSLKNIISEYQIKHKEEQSIKEKISEDVTDCRVAINSSKENILLTKENLSRI
ncbi:MAG: chromosome segregation protein SMC, partial [Clostridiales bacterium]